ncbi:hypothetical protein C6988_03810 [Nitrosopumilus sp. b1]|uniref:3D domain-containing protein n=1 Tax=Nitrosopumilus sp. b1 TaxID=2109907 RepID=UPI0015F4DA0F|nr:3D domain-containing protein [Nitrosopumilus sp. b1]KAF6243379.1 hypothetical protein C6988_03810 [Nitrosopumilus sp. b1]
MKNLWIIPIVGVTAAALILLSIEDNCSDGWYITGYYTPFESDFSGEVIEIKADGNMIVVKKEFADTVKIEGWGLMESGNYLGWYDSAFHISDSPLDMHGKKLVPQMIAADPLVLEQDSKVKIPTLVEPWNQQVLTVTDIGPSIKGKHIDVYTGEGDKARIETERITSENNVLCVT